MSPTQRNAIIMAAGTSSRFVPLSAEIPKGLLEVKGEILIERQIRQLSEAGISDITLVVGYKAEMFRYLEEKYKVCIVLNPDYDKYNNTSSLIRVLEKLGNTYICSSDNYFPQNVFKENPCESYYSALYADGSTREYCLITDKDDNIENVTVGGRDSWYMVGHVFFSKDFSAGFKEILRRDYEIEETRHDYWEDVYIRHISELPKMKIHRYGAGDIQEFDSIDELRLFDASYRNDTRSSIVKSISRELKCKEEAIHGFSMLPGSGESLSFSFLKDKESYIYEGSPKKLRKI